MQDQTSQDQTQQQGVKVYPSPAGIIVELEEGGETSTFAMSVDDASVFMMNLFTSIVMYQINNAVQQTITQKEFDQVRENIENL